MVLNVFRPCYLNKWFCKILGYISEKVREKTTKSIKNMKLKKWKNYDCQIVRMCRSVDRQSYHSLLSLPDTLHCRQGEDDTRAVLLWKTHPFFKMDGFASLILSTQISLKTEVLLLSRVFIFKMLPSLRSGKISYLLGGFHLLVLVHLISLFHILGSRIS